MPETHFTDGTLKALAHGDWVDPRYPNLVFRVGKKARTWMYRPPRRADGSRPGTKLGRFPDLNKETAVRMYEDERGRIARGEPHPDLEKRIGELEAELEAVKRAAGKLITFGELAEQFMQSYVPRSRRPWATSTRSNNRQLLRDYMLPHWKDRDAEALEEEEIEEVLTALKTTTPSAANGVHKLLGTIYRWANRKKKVKVNPVMSIDQPVEQLDRERVLYPAELKAAWKCFSEIKTAHGLALKQLVLTWQRRGEVAAMTWNEVMDGWWELPRERTKSRKRSNLIYMAPLAQKVLDLQASQANRGSYVFPGTLKDLDQPINKKVLTKRCGKISRDLVQQGIAKSHFTVHDLRRTAATTARGLGVDRRVVETILNHGRRTVTDVYDLYEMKPEIESAMKTWNDYLVDLLGLRPGDV